MINSSSSYAPHPRRNTALPPSVAKAEVRTEVRTFTPDVGPLKPGQSRLLTPLKDETVLQEADDRITFTNGGSIADKPGQQGLVLISPEGQVTEMNGYIEISRGSAQNVGVHLRTAEPDSNRAFEWTQWINADGTVQLERDFSFASHPIDLEIKDGKVAVGKVYDREARQKELQPELQDGSLRFTDGQRRQEFSPPVPLSWLVAG